jgi:mannan endo-1,4-beta-mannosidase
MSRKFWILAVAVVLVFGAAATGLVLARGGANSAAKTPAGPPPTAVTVAPSAYVSAVGGRFYLEGEPYLFVGANFWQGMNLGDAGPSGNRAMLLEDLDALRQLGVTNLRVMAASEGPNTEPHRIVPALMTAPGEYDAAVLDGLDFLLAEMGKRGLKAVMVLNNYWYWSGGMAQYVSWRDGTQIPYPGDWDAYMTYAARFYYCEECQEWYRAHIRFLIDRINPYTGKAYKEDPTVFSWELANEPREYPLDWIYGTAAYIKSLDPNHMVTTGSEGALPDGSQNFLSTHNSPDVDYATIHIWPQNWGWYDPARPEPGFTAALALAHLYFSNAERDCTTMGKPLVLEEFGLARDYEPLHNIYDPGSPTSYRDRFYQAMFDQVYRSMAAGGPAAGDNFWAWAGPARPGYPWIGDPPHETPGWYSVYDVDDSTIAVIRAHAEKVRGLRTAGAF